MEIERKLAELGIEVPAPPVPRLITFPTFESVISCSSAAIPAGSMVNRTYMPAKSAIT